MVGHLEVEPLAEAFAKHRCGGHRGIDVPRGCCPGDRPLPTPGEGNQVSVPRSLFEISIGVSGSILLAAVLATGHEPPDRGISDRIGCKEHEVIRRLHRRGFGAMHAADAPTTRQVALPRQRYLLLDGIKEGING